MRDAKRALALCLAVMLGWLASGCAAAVPCLPGEPSVNCCIKKFPLTPEESCGVPADEALRLLEAMAAAGQLLADDASAGEEESSEEAEETEAEAASASPEPPQCTGQKHHVISRPIAKALARHETLRGLYKPRDPRFVTQARSKRAHCGYQYWHRDVDREVIEWLRTHKEASAEEFEAFLRELYSRSALRWRFPHGF
ncbi:Wall-associated protein precursor [Hyalangium versicolor]|uniref:Wall-associated protein precursor n=1 Tax=Hyalangium versicolor TaxID=2861190 RepID=UPI001CCCDDB6|nr:Wall-associated protein precursor [Hyalangium versicolor]